MSLSGVAYDCVLRYFRSRKELDKGATSFQSVMAFRDGAVRVNGLGSPCITYRTLYIHYDIYIVFHDHR